MFCVCHRPLDYGAWKFSRPQCFPKYSKCRAPLAKRQTRESYFHILSAFHSLEWKSLGLSILLTNIGQCIKQMDACLPLKCPKKFFDLSCTLSLAFEEGLCPGTENVRKNIYMILHIKLWKLTMMHQKPKLLKYIIIFLETVCRCSRSFKKK